MAMICSFSLNQYSINVVRLVQQQTHESNASAALRRILQEYAEMKGIEQDAKLFKVNAPPHDRQD